MSEPRKLDEMSVLDYRSLEEVPLSTDNDEENAQDALHTIAPSGESLESNAFYEQGNKFGGQTERGTIDSEVDDLDGDPIPREGFQEILESDLEDGLPGDDIHSPEMSDMNLPGEIDIESLDESSLDETDLPADARLDPLED